MGENDAGADPAPASADALECARLGFEAVARQFSSPAGKSGRGPDFEAAERNFGAALRGLAADDPLSADVSFALGSLRSADHAARCGTPCPAPGDLPPTIALLAVAGTRDQAPFGQLYLYALALDQLSDHTHALADMEFAIPWLRRAADHPDALPGDRRRALISLASQNASRGDALAKVPGRSGPDSDSWAAYSAAIEEFGEVLAELAGPGSPADTSRDRDRLDAWLGTLEACTQRSVSAQSDADLDAMIETGRQLATAMPAADQRRSYALGLYGTALLLRVRRGIGEDPTVGPLPAPGTATTLGVVTAMMGRAERLAPAPDGTPLGAVANDMITSISRALARVPGLGADLDAAIEALGQATGLAEHASPTQPVLVAALGIARMLRYAAHGRDEDLHEAARLARIILGYPNTGARFSGARFSGAQFQRMSAEMLLPALAARARAAGRESPSQDAAIDTLTGLIERFTAADGVGLAPDLSALLASLASLQAGAEMTDAELAASYARLRQTAATTAGIPVMQAVNLLQAARAGSEWLSRGTAPDEIAGQIVADLRQALRAVPGGDRMAGILTTQLATLTTTQGSSPGPAASPGPMAGPKPAARPVPEAGPGPMAGPKPAARPVPKAGPGPAADP